MNVSKQVQKDIHQGDSNVARQTHFLDKNQ